MEAAAETHSLPQQQPQVPEDRISELPDCLLHHILSFIDTRTVIQTSFLSRRWRYVWNSLPVLNFNHDLYPDDVYNVRRNNKYLSFGQFVDRALFDFILRRRRRFTNLHSFSLLFGDCDYLRDDIRSWIQVVVVYNLVEFDLYAPRLYIQLPLSLFTCTSLTKLRLVIRSGTKLSFDDGSAANLPMLKALHLQGVEIKSKGSTTKGTFLRRCPVLETLVLANCSSGDAFSYDQEEFNDEEPLLYICSPQLKNLEIIDLNAFSSCVISAPKLMSFKCQNRLSCEYSFVDTSSLVKATIMYDEPHWQQLARRRCWAPRQDYSKDKNEATESNNLIGYLNGISSVKSLTLSTRFFEVIKVPECLQNELIQYWDLRSLRLTDVYLSRSHTSVLPYLLEKCPNVETLSLKMAKVKVDKSWRPVFPCPKLHHLKFLEIQNVVGCVNDLELLEYFMKSATMLEKVHILTFKEAESKDQYRCRGNIARKKKKKERYISVLKKFLLAYSTVEISFS